MSARSPFLRLQPDERLIALTRRGNHGAYEALVARYQARLLAFCRHMLGSREDAEDVLQEVFAAAFNAILSDDRPINVRPWLYRIARNRSLNHLRRASAIGVDSMDVHYADYGATTADKVHGREEFRQLLVDVGELPETQRTALLLREIDALSYDQIAEAMETTVPSVKSLLVRARVSLAEAAEARRISCEEVRLELGAVAEGLTRMSPPVRRHVKTCERCEVFRDQLKETNRALAAVFPIGPWLLFKKLLVTKVGAGATASGGAGVAGSAAAGGAAAGTVGGGLVSASAAAVASKAAAGLAAAAIVTVGAAEVNHAAVHRRAPHRPVLSAQAPQAAATSAVIVPHASAQVPQITHHHVRHHASTRTAHHKAAVAKPKATTNTPPPVTLPAPVTPPVTTPPPATKPTQTESDVTKLPADPVQSDGDTTTLPTQPTAGSQDPSMPTDGSGDGTTTDPTDGTGTGTGDGTGDGTGTGTGTGPDPTGGTGTPPTGPTPPAGGSPAVGSPPPLP